MLGGRKIGPLVGRWAGMAMATLGVWEPATGCELDDGGVTRIVEAAPDGRLMLADGGELALAGVQIPREPNLLEAARLLLAELVIGRPVRLFDGGVKWDRYGRRRAHARDYGDRWVQGELISAGLARVRTRPDDRACAEAMLSLERAARAARRGLWARPEYRPLSERNAMRGLGGFHLVVGRPTAASVRRGRVYLDFGDDWRQDFTVTIERRARRLFRDARIDPEALVGRRIRVRGVIMARNGPMIIVDHPEEIELLE